MFKDYVLSFHKEKVLNILKDEEGLKHFSMNINFVELFEHDPVLGNSILTNPESTLRQCDNVLLEAQQELIDVYEGGSVLTKKNNVHTRICGLPACPELHKIVFPTNEELGLFLQISGTITRISAVKMLEHKREYMCTKCKHKFVINASYEQKYVIAPPKKCTNPDFCKSTNFRVVSALDTNHCRDYQEFKMQEQVSKLQVSTMPSALWVTLEDDLVDVCKPGDSVTICGTVKRRWKINMPGKPLEVELVIKANHIEVNNDTSSTTIITSEILENFARFWEKHETFPLYGRDLILRSFCPQIYGMYVVKLAIATVLAGGSTFERDKDTGMRVRTEPHLLLVGDPGMGKSQLLRYASKVIPRSVLTTGVGSTSAGLTVTAVMEDGEWHLEGGALVLADGGICCIDEFNSMKEHDRTSIHEAMEQQTISVAKASIVSKLRTRCSILAATNPKMSLDPNESLTITVALASPLLSRFDLILFLKDNMDDEWDEKVSNYILRGYKRKSKFFDNKYNMWSLEMLQAYFLLIKKLNPVLTHTSKQILGAYYQLQRKMETRDKSRTTVRLLDSLVRLSQAHARLMCHREVETMDAIMALALVEISMRGSSSLISEFFDPHSDFLDDPMKNYESLIKIILPELQLDEILNKELQLLKSYENGELIKTSRVDIMDINVSSEINKKSKKEDKTEVKVKVANNVKLKDTNKLNDDNNRNIEECIINEQNDLKKDIKGNEFGLNSSLNDCNERRNNLDDLIGEFERNGSNSSDTQSNNKSMNSNVQHEKVETNLNKKKLIKESSGHAKKKCKAILKKRKIITDDEFTVKSPKSKIVKSDCENVRTKIVNNDKFISNLKKSKTLSNDALLNTSNSINSDIFSKEIEDAFNFIPKSTQNNFENLNGHNSSNYKNNSDLQKSQNYTTNNNKLNNSSSKSCDLKKSRNYTTNNDKLNNSSSKNNSDLQKPDHYSSNPDNLNDSTLPTNSDFQKTDNYSFNNENHSELQEIKNFDIDDENNSDFVGMQSGFSNSGDTNKQKQIKNRGGVKLNNKNLFDKNELNLHKDGNDLRNEKTFYSQHVGMNKENNDDLNKQDNFGIKNKDLNKKSEKDLLNLIPSAVFSQDLQDAFNFIPENEDITADKGKFKKNLSKLSIAKSDSGNFSMNSQNIFESLDDDFDESELDI